MGAGVQHIALCLSALGCAPSTSVQQSEPAKLHDSCLHACVNVQRIPVCPAHELANTGLSVKEVTAAAEDLDGQEVRVRGRLTAATAGVSTQIDCPKGTCCSERIDPSLALGDLRLEGTYRLPSGQSGELRCVSRDGMMVQSLAASPGARFSFEAWDRARRGDPERHRLQPAYCCNLDGHGQEVLVSATLAMSEQPFAPDQLSNPSVCALPETN